MQQLHPPLNPQLAGADDQTLPDLADPLIVQLAAYAREFMRDYPVLNRLTSKWDHSPRHLRWCVIDTASDWQATPPFIGQTLGTVISHGWQSLFIKGVIIRALESLGILHMRNYLAYSDGGMSVQTENPQLIQSWLQAMKNEYEEKKMRCLIALNIANALSGGPSGVHSELYFVNSFFGAL